MTIHTTCHCGIFYFTLFIIFLDKKHKLPCVRPWSCHMSIHECLIFLIFLVFYHNKTAICHVMVVPGVRITIVVVNLVPFVIPLFHDFIKIETLFPFLLTFSPSLLSKPSSNPSSIILLSHCVPDFVLRFWKDQLNRIPNRFLSWLPFS